MKLVIIVGGLFLAFATNAFSNDKVVYGEDNRLDIYDVTNPLYLELARSTAAHINNAKLKKLPSGDYRIVSKTLKQQVTLCSGERFSKQIVPARCSGFLVADDLIVTAGHCMSRLENDCKYNSWVFDFAVTDSGNGQREIDASKVYKCKEIVTVVLDRETKNDYAVIRLDRRVTDRRPLQIRKSGKVAKDTNLVLIGHPTGLPTKVADGATIRDNSNPIFFKSNTDSFGGNSGSAVFDSDTGLVEGILVRGEKDYVEKNTWLGMCRQVNYCQEDGCSGEEITRITNIPELINL